MEHPEEVMEVEQGPPVASASVLTYDELRVIFEFLSFKDLGSVAMVCKFWKEVAYNEMTTRKSPQFFCNVSDTKNGANEMAKQVSNALRIKPRLGIVFKNTPREDRGFKEECFSRYMPSSCQPIAIVTGMYAVGDRDYAVKQGKVTVAAFLPDISNMQVHTLDIPDEKIDASELMQKVDQFFKTYVWNTAQEPKCILMFGTFESSQGIMRHIADYFKAGYKPGTISLCGGVGFSLHTCSSEHAQGEAGTCLRDAACTIMCLSSPSLQSWSILIPRYSEYEEDYDDEAIVQKLQYYKEKIHLKKHSLALMCCTTYGANTLHHVKVDGFKKVFSGVPLVGFHGFVEYGINSLNIEREKKVQYQYSMAYLILTYD